MTFLDPRTVRFFAYFAGAYRGRTILMVVLLVISGLLEGISVITLVPVLEVAAASGGTTSEVGRVIHDILGAVGIDPTLGVLVSLVVLGITLKAIVLWLAMRQVGFTVARVMMDLRLQLVRSLLKARWSYVGMQPVGGFANSISREAARAANAYREACVVLGSLIQAIVYMVVSAFISWQVTVVAIVSGILLIRALRYFIAMGRAAGEDEMRLTRSLATRLVEALQGIKPMKAMAREDLFWPLLEGEAEGLNQAHRRSVTASETLRLFQEPIVTILLGVGLVILIGVADYSFSSVVVLAFVFYRLMSQINNLQSKYQFVANGEAMFWSLREQIDEAEAAEEQHSGTLPARGVHEAIELRDIQFSYDDLEVLDSLSVRIAAKRITAMIGASGSGKTTILDLITGLQRPDDGEVYIDGTPLAEIDLTSWRQIIGYVPQEVFLFNDTVRRNVTLGDESISDSRVEQALHDAGAWDFIARDPKGLDAVISPQAANLSGGQRQRLAVARALVKEPSLLVLDEATTGLDEETEAGILATLQALRGKVTIFAISHQPALKEAADVTLELKNGQILAGGADSASARTVERA